MTTAEVASASSSPGSGVTAAESVERLSKRSPLTAVTRYVYVCVCSAV